MIPPPIGYNPPIYYAIGDIHGEYAKLIGLCNQIENDPIPGHKVIVFLGDYIDRGPQSMQVLDFIMELRTRRDTVCLMGNHESLLLLAMQGSANAQGAWLMNGGIATLESFLGRKPIGNEYDPRNAVPEKYRNFLRNQIPYLHIPPYLFVHAGIRPGVPLAEQKVPDMLWIRDKFLNSDMDHGYIVVHGHTPARKPQLRQNRIGIDTGACDGGPLTCAVIQVGQVPRLLQQR